MTISSDKSPLFDLPLELFINVAGRDLSSAIAVSRTCKMAHSLWPALAMLNPSNREKVQEVAFKTGFVPQYLKLQSLVKCRPLALNLENCMPQLSQLRKFVDLNRRTIALRFANGQHLKAGTTLVPLSNSHFCDLMSPLKYLQELTLHGCRSLRSVGLGSIAKQVHLRKLDLYLIKIGSRILDAITKNCTRLNYLSLSRCRDISRLGLAKISRLTSLTFLDLSQTKIDADGLQSILSEVKGLTDLRLKGCNNLHNLNFTNISLALTHVDLSYAEIRDGVVTAFLESAEHLKSLNLSDTFYLRHPKLSPGREVTALTSLSISRSAIRPKGLVELLAALPNLTHLALAENKYLAPEDLQHISSLAKLKTLDISYTKVTDAGLQAILDGCKHLQTVFMFGTKASKPILANPRRVTFITTLSA